MKTLCEICGWEVVPSEFTEEQLKFYDANICKECWIERYRTNSVIHSARTNQAKVNLLDLRIVLKELGYRVIAGPKETLDFVRSCKGHEHISFIYENRNSLSAVMPEFFRSDIPEESKCLVSLAPIPLLSVKKMLYRELSKGDRQSILKKYMGFFEYTHSSNRSRSATRMAGEDSTWFLENGLFDEHQELEYAVGREGVESRIILCGYDMAAIPNKTAVERIIGSHRYVIIEQPLTLYA